EQMIRLVTMAEEYVAAHTSDITSEAADGMNPIKFASLRRAVSEERGGAMNARFRPLGFANIKEVKKCGTRGPVTPDHVLHTKRTPMIISGDLEDSVQDFATDYQKYFDKHNDGSLTCLDRAPRWGIYKGKGVATFGINGKRLQICSDIVDTTVKAIAWGEQMDGWEALPARDIFELEYWELEQAKLKNMPAAGDFDGKVAVVTGAASGIGKAAAEALVKAGACVIGIDIKSDVTDIMNSPAYIGVEADLTDSYQIEAALTTGVMHFGGVDILVSNAGNFPASAYLADTSDDEWDRALSLNLDSHFKVLRAAIPYLKEGFDPSVIFMASKNTLAPGPGVGPYSVSKAALTQLARVAALELAEDEIRVNVLHPDAVFDTGIWTDEVLEGRAKKYGLSVEEYKRRNLLKTEISSADVANAVVAMANSTFAKSTGLQLTIDGGNERTI
ncbi:MAG: SDR family oxidoreductase, partial [Gammaproteobacteria bacterium]